MDVDDHIMLDLDGRPISMDTASDSEELAVATEAEPEENQDIPEFFFSQGVFSHTLVKSSKVLWIIPACIRSSTEKNDVIFVGEDSIQLKTYFQGRLEDINPQFFLDARILAAKSIGVVAEPETAIKTELSQKNSGPDQDIDMRNTPGQMLVLVLETSNIVFVHVAKGQNGNPTFSMVTRKLPAFGKRADQLGHHTAVDPM